jgi:hypothetical protein
VSSSDRKIVRIIERISPRKVVQGALTFSLFVYVEIDFVDDQGEIKLIEYV